MLFKHIYGEYLKRIKENAKIIYFWKEKKGELQG